MGDGLSLRSLLPGPMQSGKKGKQRKAEPTAFSRAAGAFFGFVLRRFADIVLAGLFITGFLLFKYYYYEKNPAFLVDPDTDIVLSENTSLTLAMLRDTFGWHKPKSGFEFVSSEAVTRLKTQMPSIKDVRMEYRPGGGKLMLEIEDRKALARLSGLVVDEDGVLFRPSRSLYGYPEISGFDLPVNPEPGSRLPLAQNCMLHLIAAATDPDSAAGTRLPSAIQRVTQLGSEVDDGLLVLLADGRRIRIAWENMATETVYSDGMLRRLRNLATVLSNPLMTTKRDFNAMAPDRVTVVDEDRL